jgi:hypothetical protein
LLDWNDPEVWRAWREGRLSWEEVELDDAKRRETEETSMDHEAEPVERWPDDVLADDHPTPPIERWPDDVLAEDHPTEPVA